MEEKVVNVGMRAPGFYTLLLMFNFSQININFLKYYFLIYNSV